MPQKQGRNFYAAELFLFFGFDLGVLTSPFGRGGVFSILPSRESNLLLSTFMSWAIVSFYQSDKMGIAAIIVGVFGFLLISSALGKISDQLEKIISHLNMIRERIVRHFPP